jgi:hypothetical protein
MLSQTGGVWDQVDTQGLQVVVNALLPLPYVNLLSLVTNRAFPEIDFRN